MKRVIPIFGLLISIVLTACGGGGASGSTPAPATPQPSSSPVPSPVLKLGFAVPESWSTLLNADVLSLSKQEIEDAYFGLALSQYEGITMLADLTPDNIQSLLEASQKFEGTWVYIDEPLKTAGVEIYTAPLVALTGLPYEFDTTVACRSGTVDIRGNMTDGTGTVAIAYNNCDMNAGPISGAGAAYGRPVVTVAGLLAPYFEGAYFYNSVDCDHCGRGQNTKISGFYDYHSERDGNTLIASHTYDYLLYDEVDLGRQSLIRLDRLNNTKVIDGTIALSAIGYVEVNTSTFPVINSPPLDPIRNTIVFRGKDNQKAYFSYFFWGHTKLEIDRDGDGSVDVGQYFISAIDFFSHDFSQYPLIPIADMDHPPILRVNNPGWEIAPRSGFDAEVNIDEFSYFDPDTPMNELIVNFIWLINGAVQDDINGNVLPAERFQLGDFIEFYYTVSDTHRTVVSNRISLNVFN